jgi:hypothetical protein
MIYQKNQWGPLLFESQACIKVMAKGKILICPQKEGRHLIDRLMGLVWKLTELKRIEDIIKGLENQVEVVEQVV